jgi:WD40 repeat protein
LDGNIIVWDLAGGPNRVLRGHSGRVRHLLPTPDGRLLSSADDGMVRVWDLEDGAQLAETGTSGERAFDALALVRDGRWAVSHHRGGRLQIHQLAQEAEAAPAAGPQRVTAFGVTPDGSRIFFAEERDLYAWDMSPRATPNLLLPKAPGACRALGVTRDGSRLVLVTSDFVLHVLEAETGRPIRTLPALSAYHQGNWADRLTLTAEDCAVLQVDHDRVAVWDIRSGSLIRDSRELRRTLRHLTVSADGQLCFFDTEEDDSLWVWDLVGAAPPHELGRIPDLVHAAGLSADGQRVVSVSDDFRLRVWDTAADPSGHNSPRRGAVRQVGITPDGAFAIAARGKHWVIDEDEVDLTVWDARSGAALYDLLGHSSQTSALAVTQGVVLAGAKDGTVLAWRADTGERLHAFRGHTAKVNALAVCPGASRFLSGAADGTLKVWDLKRGVEERTLAPHTDEVIGVALLRGGALAVSASLYSTLRLWNLESGVLLRPLDMSPHRPSGMAVTPDGRWAVVMDYDNTVTAWDLSQEAPARTLTVGGGYWATRPEVTPDGRRALAVCRGDVIRVWDLETGAEQVVLRGHTDEVRAVRVTADGRRVVSSSDDGTLRVWDLEGGQEVARFSGDSPLLDCAITPDGRTIVAGEDGGALHLLHLEEPGPFGGGRSVGKGGA